MWHANNNQLRTQKLLSTNTNKHLLSYTVYTLNRTLFQQLEICLQNCSHKSGKLFRKNSYISYINFSFETRFAKSRLSFI